MKTMACLNPLCVSSFETRCAPPRPPSPPAAPQNTQRPLVSDPLKHLSIRLVRDQASKYKAHRLLQTVYRRKGYLDSLPGEALPHLVDDSNVLTILTESRAGEALGTASLESTCDLLWTRPSGAPKESNHPLPCEAIFSEELKALPKKGRRIGEITKLALVEGAPFAKSILVQQFNLLYILAHRVFGLTDFVIEVNPRHVRYYERGFGFKRIGTEKPCPRVGGAPAALLHLDLNIPSKALADREKGKRVPRMYAQFQAAKDEWAAAHACASATLSVRSRHHHEKRP